MVKTPNNLSNYDGRERADIEEHFYYLQLKQNHGSTPDELEKLRMIKAGLLKPDGGEMDEAKEKEEKPSKELEVVEKDE